jgi:hypothetical protein
LGEAAEFVVAEFSSQFVIERRDRISTIIGSLVRWKMRKKKQNVPEVFESFTNMLARKYYARSYDGRRKAV